RCAEHLARAGPGGGGGARGDRRRRPPRHPRVQQDGSARSRQSAAGQRAGRGVDLGAHRQGRRGAAGRHRGPAHRRARARALRIVAIPLFLILLEDFRYGEALAVFVAAGITDGLDGAIARLTHTKTTLGAYLDPAADKLLLLSAFIALGFMHAVPRWLAVVVISRDVVIVLGYFLLFMLTQRTMQVQPSVFG